MRGLENKRIIITGAASGIGRACAQRFAAEGADLCLVDVVADGAAAGQRVFSYRHPQPGLGFIADQRQVGLHEGQGGQQLVAADRMLAHQLPLLLLDLALLWWLRETVGKP